MPSHLLPKIHRRGSQFLAPIALAVALSSASANILKDWQFNDTAGTPLTEAVNTGAHSGTFESNVGNSFTTGTGVYRISRNIALGNQFAHASFSSNEPLLWLVAELGGWAFSTEEGGYNEELRIGFSPTSGTEQFAEIFLGRTASPNGVVIKGLAELRSAGAQWVAPVPQLLPHVQEEPVRLVLKLDRSSPDPDDYSYSIYYNVNNQGHIYVGSGKVDWFREPNFIRVRALNSFNDRLDPSDPNSPREYVDLNRLYVTTVDPIGDDIIPAPVAEVPEQKLVHDWRFNESEGTPLGETVDSVGGLQWLPYSLNPGDDIGDSATTGDGAFRIRRAAGSGATTNMMAYIERIWTGKQWYVADFRGWNLVGAASEQIRFGFLDTHQVDPTPYAEFRLRRWTAGATGIPAHLTDPDPDAFYFSGQIFGASNGAQGIPDAPIFPATQTEPVRIVLEVDEDEKTYAIYYRIGDGDYILFGESTTDFTLGPNALRFHATNAFSQEGEFLDVERIFLTRINPMIPVEGGYAGWAEENFPGGGADAEPGADPDGDGVTNLLEYAFGGNPNVANREILPAGMLGQNQLGESFLQVEFTRNPDADDVTYTVKASTDLVDWTTIASASNGGAFVASGASSIEVDGDTVTVSDSEPATGARRFLKVDVTLSEN